MPTNHTVIIYDDGFSDPDPGPVVAGDTVQWKNNGGSIHTATSRPGSAFEFDTKDIAANGGTSNQITFSVASDHGGFPYWCHHHHEMQSSIRVNASSLSLQRLRTLTVEQSEPNLFRGPVTAITSLEMEIWPRSAWRAMRQVCTAGACYDLTQDFVYSLETLADINREKVNKEWQRLRKWWEGKLGWSAPLHNEQILGEQPWELLEQLFRRLRVSWFALNRANPPLVGKYPTPLSIQSHDPFGKAITVLPGKAPPYISVAFERHAPYAWKAATDIEMLYLDVGKAIPTQLRDEYKAARKAITASDYLILALRQVRGLSSLFQSSEFSLDKFKEGYWRMTRNAEWDTPPRSAFHWVQFIEGYLGAAETGVTPHLVSPSGTWVSQTPPPTDSIHIYREFDILKVSRVSKGITSQGTGILIGDHLFTGVTPPVLGGGGGVLILSVANAQVNGIWAFSPFAGQGSMEVNGVGSNNGFEGKYVGSFIRADGIRLDTGAFELKKIPQNGDIELYQFTWKGESDLIGIGITATRVLNADDETKYLAVAFTRARPNATIMVGDYTYDLDSLKGTTALSAEGRLTNETLTREIRPLDY